MTYRSFALFVLMHALLMCSIFGLSAHAGPLSVPEYAQIRVVPSSLTVVPGAQMTVYIDQTIIPKWHTYWKNPGDSGTPTIVTWDVPPGTEISDLSYPTPSRIPFGPLTNFGYENRAVFTSVLTVPSDFSGKTFTATANVEWLVCNDICIPERDSVTITAPVTKKSTPNPDAQNLADIVTKTHPVPVDFGAIFSERDGKFEIFAMINHPDVFYRADDASNLAKELNLSRAVFFPTEWGLIDNSAPQETQYDGSEDGKNLPFIILAKRGDRPLADIKEFRTILAVPDGQGTIHGFDMMVRIDSTLGTNDLITSDEKTPMPDPRLRGDDVGGGDDMPLFWPSIFGALLAGLILNLMPCVLPVLFIKILAVAKLSGAERAHARMHGVMYAAGVVATFVALAGILVVLQMAGAHVGWGFQLQSPFIVAALALLFLGIGLNLWGVFEVNLTRYIPSRLQSVSDHSSVGSFMTGILAVLVATPCTVPFMGAALAYGLSHGPVMTVAVFTAMGLGLSAPFVVLTFVPMFMQLLPRPGAWMITFRRVCAVPMALTALWLLWVLSVQVGVLSSPYAVLETTQKEQTTGTATVFTPQNLQDALKTDRPVFVNMTAAWCITCKYNERVALLTPATQKLFLDHNVLYMVGDWTNYNVGITDYLNQFDRRGVPIYVFYDIPNKTTGRRPDPILLPQLLTETILRDLFNPSLKETIK